MHSKKEHAGSTPALLSTNPLPQAPTPSTQPAEAPIHASALVQGFFEASHDLICVVNLEGFLCELNPAWTELLGFSEADLKEKHLIQFAHPDDRRSTLEAVANSQRGEHVHRFENRMRCKDGGFRWIGWSSARLASAPGCIYGIGRDLSPFKLAQEALASTGDRLEQALDIARLGCWSMEAADQTFMWSSRVFEMLGMQPSAEPFSRARFLSMICCTDRQRVESSISKLLQRRERCEIEFCLTHADGHEVHVACAARVELTEHGEPVRLLGVVHDITHVKHAEVALAKSEAQLRAVIENIVDALITIDESGRIESINPAGDRLFGYPKGSLIGQNVSVLMPHEHAHQHDGYLRRYIETRQPRIIGIGREVLGRLFDGRLLPLELSVAEVMLGDKRYFSGILRDITERKRAEQKLEQQNIELERASRMKSEFLATMSHELRTPLNAILGFSEVLRDGALGALTEAQQDYVGEIHESGLHLLALIDDILDLSKIEAGRMQLEVDTIDAQTFFPSALGVVRERAYARGVGLTCTVQPDLDLFFADPRRIKQIVYNLLSNAVKFTPTRGRVSLTVLRQTSPAGPMLEIVVEDTGIGISEDEQTKLFQPFYQVDSSIGRRFGGTGLGLVMVRRLCELHGGSVRVSSVLGQGSSFAVALPLREPVSPAELAADDHALAESIEDRR